MKASVSSDSNKKTTNEKIETNEENTNNNVDLDGKPETKNSQKLFKRTKTRRKKCIHNENLLAGNLFSSQIMPSICFYRCLCAYRFLTMCSPFLFLSHPLNSYSHLCRPTKMHCTSSHALIRMF